MTQVWDDPKFRFEFARSVCWMARVACLVIHWRGEQYIYDYDFERCVLSSR